MNVLSRIRAAFRALCGGDARDQVQERVMRRIVLDAVAQGIREGGAVASSLEQSYGIRRKGSNP